MVCGQFKREVWSVSEVNFSHAVDFKLQGSMRDTGLQFDLLPASTRHHMMRFSRGNRCSMCCPRVAVFAQEVLRRQPSPEHHDSLWPRILVVSSVVVGSTDPQCLWIFLAYSLLRVVTFSWKLQKIRCASWQRRSRHCNNSW